jgi:hypothetical protein
MMKMNDLARLVSTGSDLVYALSKSNGRAKPGRLPKSPSKHLYSRAVSPDESRPGLREWTFFLKLRKARTPRSVHKLHTDTQRGLAHQR